MKNELTEHWFNGLNETKEEEDGRSNRQEKRDE